MCTAAHRVIHCSKGLPTTPPNHSASAKYLLLFHDHNHGKTCHRLQFQFICITYSCYCTFLALPWLMPWKIHAQVCKMRHSIILILLHRTSTPWMTTWIVKCATRNKKYTETSKANSISQPPCAKHTSLQPWHLPCNICYSSRAAQGSHGRVTVGVKEPSLYFWVQFWKEEKQPLSKMWVWVNPFKALLISIACNKVQAEQFAAKMFKRNCAFQSTSITTTLQIPLC